MMSTVTYSEAAVVDAIHGHFVPVHVDTHDESSQPIIQRFRQAWTPDLRILGSDGFEYDRWNGYLPPYEFLPRLLLGLGQAALRSDHLEDAAAIFENLLRVYPTSEVAPEALYWEAVARYKESGNGSDLVGTWSELRSRYPSSIWRMKQIFSEQQ